MTIISSVQEKLDDDPSTSANTGSLETTDQNGSCDRWSWSERPISEEKVCREAARYTGSMCRQELQILQECVGLQGDELVVGMQALDEEIISEIQRVLSVEDESCRVPGFQFVCHYNYPLYDCSTNTAFLATREDCLRVSTEVCAPIWTLALALGYDEYLPNCDDLPSSDTIQPIGNHIIPFIITYISSQLANQKRVSDKL